MLADPILHHDHDALHMTAIILTSKLEIPMTIRELRAVAARPRRGRGDRRAVDCPGARFRRRGRPARHPPVRGPHSGCGARRPEAATAAYPVSGRTGRRGLDYGTSLAYQWIVALTANAMKGDRMRYLDAAMDDYLSKPIKPSRLRRVLDERATAAHLVAIQTRSHRSRRPRAASRDHPGTPAGAGSSCPPVPVAPSDRHRPPGAPHACRYRPLPACVRRTQDSGRCPSRWLR